MKMQNRGGWAVAGSRSWGWVALHHWPQGLLSGPAPQETDGTCSRAGWAALTLKACLPAAHSH